MIRFIDALGRVFVKPRLRQICEAAELSDIETKLILLRCSDGIRSDALQDFHGITTRQQRVLVPLLCDKLRLWVSTTSVLTDKELFALGQVLREFNLPPVE